MKISHSFLSLMLAAAFAAGSAQLARAQGGGGGGGAGGFLAGLAGGAGGRGGAGNNQGLRTSPVNASYDARTNTVVVSGPTDTLDEIIKVIHDIDNNPAADAQVFPYRLKNASALNVEAVANLLFTGTGGQNRGLTSATSLGQNSLSTSSGRGGGLGGGGGGGGLGGGAAGGARGGGARGGGIAGGGGVAQFGGLSQNAQSNVAGLIGQVTVIADPVTNTLLVTTNPKNWDRVRGILDELDRAIPQVLIKVLIAEVTHSNSVDLGVEFSVLNKYPLSVLNSGGTFSTIAAGQQVGTVFGLPNFGTSGASGAIASITESNFTALLHALATNQKLDVLSRPYILASDNQLATITVGQTVPYVSNSQTTDTGTTNNTVLYTNIGILLNVIPHINPDGLVILDVAPEISALTDSNVKISESVSAPIYTIRSAQTRVAIQSGETAVIGGLMQDQKTQTISKVPLLGDIPLLGELFKHRVEGKSKTELLIFLTPHVAARPEYLGAMGRDELDHTKLTPNAVSAETFDEQIKGLNVGDRPIPASTQPSRSAEQLQQQQQPPPGRGGFGPRGFGGRGQGGGGGGGGRGGE